MLTIDDVVIYVSTCKKRRKLALAIRDTWARGLSNVYFISDENCSDLPNCINLGVIYRNQLSIKTFMTLQYMRAYHGDKKWFVKVDDDSCLFVDAMLKALSQYDIDEPLYMGDIDNVIKHFGSSRQPIKWIGGGAVFLSRSCLHKLTTFLRRLPALEITFHEDCWLSDMLSKLEIFPTHLPGCHHFNTVEHFDTEVDAVSIHDLKGPKKLTRAYEKYSNANAHHEHHS